jgi:hypothetical protein
MRFPNGLLDWFVRPLRLHDKEREAATPDRIVGDVADALARAFIDLGGLHVFLGANPFGRDIHEAGMHKERIDELLLHVAFGDKLRNVRDRRLYSVARFELGNQVGKSPGEETSRSERFGPICRFLTVRLASAPQDFGDVHAAREKSRAFCQCVRVIGVISGKHRHTVDSDAKLAGDHWPTS